jgi:hypothetical protein
MEDLLYLISNVGFPIVVSIYLLMRIETQISKLSDAITDLREALITLPPHRVS